MISKNEQNVGNRLENHELMDRFKVPWSNGANVFGVPLLDPCKRLVLLKVSNH